MPNKPTIWEASLNKRRIIGVEVLTAVVIKSAIFWDITPCSLLKVNRCFGGTYCLHFQGRKICRERSQVANRAFTQVSYSAYFSTLKMEAICCSETSVYFQLFKPWAQPCPSHDWNHDQARHRCDNPLRFLLCRWRWLAGGERPAEHGLYRLENNARAW
jgi:hypothetical protein